MKSAAVCLLFLAAAAAAPACGTESQPSADPMGVPGMPETAPETPEPEMPAPESPAPDSPAPAAGFPCDVHAVLQTYCAGCHMGQTYSVDFSTRDHMLAPYNGTTLGQVAAAAVRDLRMPRYGAIARPTAAEREVLLSWVAGGMTAGTCGELTRPAP